MKPCEYCGEHYTEYDDGWQAECDCAERENEREYAYWREIDRQIDIARGK